MPNKSIYVDALCPFFQAESVKSVTCEGIIGQDTVTRFSYSEQKVNHEKRYCASAFSTCPIYKANMKKY